MKICILQISKSEFTERLCKTWFLLNNSLPSFVKGYSVLHRKDGPAYRTIKEGELDWVEYWDQGICILAEWEDKE